MGVLDSLANPFHRSDSARAASHRAWRVGLLEICRTLLLVALPFNQVVAIQVGGNYLNLTEFIIPLILLALMLQVAEGKLHVERYQVATLAVLFVTLLMLSIVVVLLQGQPSLRLVKVILGNVFIFLTYFIFSRSTPKQSARHLAVLAWAGGFVAVVSIALGFTSISSRLDSVLWGMTNVFAASLIVPIAAGFIGILLYRKLHLLLPVSFSVLALLLTQSRGSFLALVLTLTLIGVAQRRKPLIAMISLAAATLFFLGTISLVPRQALETLPVYDRLEQEYTYISNFLYSGSDFDKRQVMSGRLFIWDSALAQIASRPLVGQPIREIYVPTWAGQPSRLVEDTSLSFHNWALNIAATYGLLILFANILLLGTALWPYWHKPTIPMRMVLAVLVVIVLYGLAEPMFEGGFFASNTVSSLFWILAGIGIHLPDGTRNVPYQNKVVTHKPA
jgi:hypothetical protein